MKVSIRIKLIVIAILMVAMRTPMFAQRLAITTNLLEDVVLTPNLGFDIVLSDKQSIAFDASYSPYKLSSQFHNKRMTFRTEYKFWLNQAFYAHYIGIDAVASSSEVGLGGFSSRDEYIGLGIGYGYSFIIGKRLNIVPSIGIGLAYGNNYEGHDHMSDTRLPIQAVQIPGFKPILTRLSVTLQYILR